jgi:DNA-binding transcriptional LysR family regulator
LLDTKSREIVPTAAGELLRAFAEKAEADATRTRERIRDLGAARAFRIGATRTIGEFVMPRCIASWLAAYPGTDLSLCVDNSANLFSGLRRGLFDFVFIEGPFSREAYTTRVLFGDVMVPVCSPANRFALARVDIAELMGETLLAREEGSGSRILLEQALARGNRSLDSFHRLIEVGNIGAIKSLAAADAGIAFLFALSVSAELERGILARIELADFSIAHDYSFVCLPDALYEAEYLSFFDHCREIFHNKN